MADFDWNRARAFLNTAETGSLSAAARRLGTTQPTVSRQVMALEDELEVVLFERVAQKLVLSEAGLALVEPMRQMELAAQQFSLIASGQSSEPEGEVVLSVCEVDALKRLPPILDELRHTFPNIRVEVIVTNQPSDLGRREADIAIRNFRPEQQDFVAVQVGNEQIRMYATARYLAQLGNRLERVQFIGFNPIGRFTDMLAAHGVTLTPNNVGLTTNNQPMQIELCLQHMGIILLPEDIASHYPQLQAVSLVEGSLMILPVWLVMPQALKNSARVKCVYDFLAKQLRSRLNGN